MTAIYLEYKGFIEGCANNKVAARFGCMEWLEDLLSAGWLAFLEHAGRYDEQQCASLTTFLHPHIVGAMRREAERNLTPFCLSKREFARIIRTKALTRVRGVSLDEPVDEEGEERHSVLPTRKHLLSGMFT